jgi:hypothetical protein
MKKYIVFFVSIMFLIFLPLQALQVNKGELETTGANDTIVFKNYTGPHLKIDTIEEIRAIGQRLARPIAADVNTPITTGQSDFYQVIHAIDPSDPNGLDADIFIIGKNATIDHINNLRRVIAAYLETAYGYSADDADTLSVFITVYNAVYRADLDIYKTKYKAIVTSKLDASICGLSTNYEDWPGKTQIVIPLSELTGGISTIETSIISDKKVVNSMQEEPEKQIEVRKNMVDIKEREADSATQDAQKAQKEATISNHVLDTEEQELTEKQKEASLAIKNAENATKAAENATQEAEIAKKIAIENPDDKEIQQVAKEKEAESIKKQEEASNTQQEALSKQEEAKQQEAIVADAQKAAEDKQNTASEKQAKADKKQSEAQDERVDIAKDQLEVIQEKAKASKIVNTTYGLRMTDQENMLSTLVKIDSDTGLIVKESPVSYIRNRTVLPNGENFTAIAGETGRNAAIKLVTLDKTNMEIIDESDFNIAEKSVLIMQNNFFYAILQDGKNYVVGKFNTDLDLVLKSNVAVMTATPIIVTNAGIVVTDTWGIAKLLNSKDLSEVTAQPDITKQQ